MIKEIEVNGKIEVIAEFSKGTTRLQALLEVGGFYGYPKCCTEWLYRVNPRPSIDSPTIKYMNDHQKKVSLGTGFIACPECASKIKSKRELTKLFVNRKSKEDFFEGVDLSGC